MAAPRKHTLLEVIRQPEQEKSDELAAALSELNQLKKTISVLSKRNYRLNNDISALDKKIALLLKNRITIEEALQAKNDIFDMKEKSVVLRDKSSQFYGRLFWLLQHRTRYIARLARLVKLQDIDSLLQTVMFTLYGNQYEEEEEHLLLTMFQTVLAEEFKQATSINTILRQNTGLTRMMNTYTRRGPGQQYLKHTLQQLITKVISFEDSLDINPSKVLEAYVNDYETKQGKPYAGERKLTAEQAAELPIVQELVRPRVAKLEQLAEEFVAVLIKSTDFVPYGIRWISKQIRDLTKSKYPEATEKDVCSLIGGFFLLRLINPAVATPNAYQLAENQLSSVARRNLTLIAKMLQNLANNVAFGGKEFYMTPLNSMLSRQVPILNSFLLRLCDVENLDENLSLDRYVALGKGLQFVIVNITLNEMYFIHNLLVTNSEQVFAPAEGETGPDEVYELIKSVGGDPPAQVPRKDNANVELKLIPSNAVSQSVRPEQLYSETKFLFFNVLRSLPKEVPITDGDIKRILLQIAKWAKELENKDMLEKISRVLLACKKLASAGILSEQNNYNRLKVDLVEELSNYNLRIARMRADKTKLCAVLQNLNSNIDFANKQLKAYEEYLSDVRTKTSTVAVKKKAQKGSRRSKHHITGPFKFSHAQLMRDGIVTLSSVPEDRRSNIEFVFRSPVPGSFEVTVQYRSRSIADLRIQFDDLLEKQSVGQPSLETDFLTLNVNLLIFLLNKYFLS